MSKTDTNKLLGSATEVGGEEAPSIDDDITKQVKKAAPELDVDTQKVGLLIDGRYQITGLIGRGGMGSVYKAEHTGIRRSVAIKLLHPTLSSVPEVSRRFEREAFAIGRIEHPNCVNVTDFGKLEDGSLFLVMEYLEGTSLGDLLAEQQCLKPRDALGIIRHVLRGLGHAHQEEIVHRDVKPENVLLVDQEGDPLFAKILDFGVAKLMGEAATDDGGVKLTQAGVAFGTPVYMSPEQAMGNPVDGRADLYAATIMLYEMITGVPPFKSHDKLEILSMHATRKPKPLAEMVPDVELPPGLQELVSQGLEKRPQHRYQTAHEYVEAIDDVLAGRKSKRTGKRAGTVPLLYGADGTSTNTSGPIPNVTGGVLIQPPQQWWQSHKLFYGLAALAFISIVTVVAVLATRDSGKKSGPKESNLAVLAENVKGDPAAVIELLRDKADAIANDTKAQLLLGHAYTQTSNPGAALAVYQRALKLDEQKALADPGLRANLVTWAEEESNTKVRHMAVALAQKHKFADKIDWYKAYIADLKHDVGCINRRKAIDKLVKLGDRRAINELYEAKIRRGTVGKYKGRRLNRCLFKAATVGMKKLRQMHAPDAGAPKPNKK